MHDLNANISQQEFDIDFEAMLHKYGPEGLYEIAYILKEIADKDVADAMKDTEEDIKLKH